VYLQIKDNPWSFVNLFKLCQNARMGEGEVIELLKIANGYLPRVRLEYDRLNDEMNLRKAEKNSLNAEIGNAVRTYQDFCDRNVELKKREDQLQLIISELENKQAELQKTTLIESQSEVQENDDFNLEVKEEEVISMINVLTQQPNMAIEYPTLPKLNHHPGH
jgi:chromosome segregation ATPase